MHDSGSLSSVSHCKRSALDSGVLHGKFLAGTQKLRKAANSFVMFVHLSAWKTLLPLDGYS